VDEWGTLASILLLLASGLMVPHAWSQGSVAWLRHLGGVLHKRGIGQDSVFLTDCVQSLKSNQWEDFVWVRLGRILVETTGALSLPR
jgi:hypothetical protein